MDKTPKKYVKSTGGSLKKFPFFYKSLKNKINPRFVALKILK